MAMMTKRYVRDEIIYKQLSETLKQFGFRYVKTKGSIMRSNKSGFDRIVIPVTDYSPIFWVGMTLMIRIDCVENIVNLFMEDAVNKDYMNITPTSTITLNNLYCREYFEVQTEEELKNVTQILEKLMLQEGMYYFEQRHDIYFMNSEMKRQILYEHKDLGFFHDRVTLMHSLVLMKLCNDNDFEKLYPLYLDYFIPNIGTEEQGRKAMIDLINYLKK